MKKTPIETGAFLCTLKWLLEHYYLLNKCSKIITQLINGNKNGFLVDDNKSCLQLFNTRYPKQAPKFGN